VRDERFPYGEISYKELFLNYTIGETWNLMKIGYQLKQVRERLAKGLVDKGILRTEKRNFLLFDMATHPVADGGAKEEIRRRVRNVLTQRTVVLPASQFLPENLEFRYTRTIAMVCAAYAANVLENALATLGHEARERAFAQVDELLAEYSQWPFGKRAGGASGVGANLGQVISEEVSNGKDKELQLEVSFTRLRVCSKRSQFPRLLQHVSVCSRDWTLSYKCEAY
jgi:Golgi phosphoprotein 3